VHKNASFFGVYFLIISVLFYFLWLSEIVPAIISATVPKSVSDAGLFTNAVHVIDLSIVLPCIFITGVLVLKRNILGFILAPIMLTFFILMDITIGFLAIMIKIQGVGSDLYVASIMGLLAVISSFLLALYFKNGHLIEASNAHDLNLNSN
jgi:hypothetical protein